MLDHRQLTNDLCLEHLHETLCDFAPVADTTDVVKDWAALTKGDTFLNLFDERDATKVHIVLAIIGKGSLAMHAIRGIALHVVNELTGSEKESQYLIVIQSPNTMGTRGLKNIDQLYLSHERQIALEYLVDKRLQVLLLDQTKFEQAQAGNQEV